MFGILTVEEGFCSVYFLVLLPNPLRRTVWEGLYRKALLCIDAELKGICIAKPELRNENSCEIYFIKIIFFVSTKFPASIL